MESGTARTDRSPLARPAARRRMPLARGRRRHPHHSADARTREHPANAALLERDRRGNAARPGSELEERTPTASPGVGKLIGLVRFRIVRALSPGTGNFGCGGSQPAEFGVLLGRRVVAAEAHVIESLPRSYRFTGALEVSPRGPAALECLGVPTARLVRPLVVASRELSNGRVLSATLDRSSGRPASPSHAIETAYRLSVSR
jgi:hypothetical protein